ncbi:MAG TPA: hypothetical protein DDW68_02020 [Verrucomicrobiales bacterium]|nr:hypothetical protein [Verrucomicrobiales bacterium]HBE95932.1 hypothetical protein [Verrucomicrobiales bacterium]
MKQGGELCGIFPYPTLLPGGENAKRLEQGDPVGKTWGIKKHRYCYRCLKDRTENWPEFGFRLQVGGERVIGYP